MNNNNEPLEIDDYIEYYLPNAVYGNKESLRRAHVINISEPSLGGSLFWLELSSGDLLPEDHRIKRIKGKTGKVIIGTYREVQNYYMKDNKYMNNTTSSTNESDNTQTRLAALRMIGIIWSVLLYLFQILYLTHSVWNCWINLLH